MADDIIARIKEEGLSNFVKLIIQAGKETENTGKQVDELNDSLSESGKESKSIAEVTKESIKLKKELKSVESQSDKTFDDKRVKELKKEISQVDKEAGRLVGGMNNLKKAAIGAFTVTAVAQFIKILGQAAIEIDSTGAKVKKVFGDSTKDIERFAKSNAISLGLTTNEYKKAAAAAGDLLIPIGFQRKEAAKLSNDLVSLSGALAAWSGGQYNASQVSEILTKALLGEREQLKSLGISITEADVSTRLLDKGQKNLTGTLLQQAKAQATLELITEKSRDAQRAFADDTKTLAEQQLELNASIREVRDGLATVLIPVIGDFFDLLLFGGTVVKALIDDVREFFGLGAEGQAIISGYSKEAEDAARKALEIQEEGLRLAKGRDVINQAEVDAIQDAVNLRQKELDRLLAIKKLKEDSNDDVAIKNAANSLNELNERLKKQNEIIATSDPLSKRFENAVIQAEKLKKEIKDITDLMQLLARGPVEQVQVAIEKITNSVKIGNDEFGELSDNALSAYDRIIAKAKETADAEKAVQQEKNNDILNSSIDVANGLTNIISQAYSTQLANLEDKNNRGLISDKEYEKKRSELLTKQAKADKAAAIIQAGINTALQITQVLAKPFLIPIVAALGAAQIAFIAAQPIPQFKEGVEGFKGGLAVVGDGGKREPVTDKKGKLIGVSPNKPTLVNLPQGANVFKSEDNFVRMMLKQGVPLQYNYSMIQDKINTSSPSIEGIVKDKAKAEAIKGMLAGIDLNPLLTSNDSSKLYLGSKLDKINKTLKQKGYTTTRRNG